MPISEYGWTPPRNPMNDCGTQRKPSRYGLDLMFSAPEPLTSPHQFAAFDSGVASFDAWLTRRAAHNQTIEASPTFVTCDERRVIGDRGLLVHALPEKAREFYIELSLASSPFALAS